MSREIPVFLMSPPRNDWTLRGRANLFSQAATAVDARRARKEWSQLADAIAEAGGDVVVCPPNPRRNLTGMIYAAEAGDFHRDSSDAPRFLLPNMAVEHRRDEADWIGGFMEGIGISTIAVRATWEGQGDVLRADDGDRVVHTFGSGKYHRTEARAYEEVAYRIGGQHIQLHFRADPWFHGNTFMNFYRGPKLPPRLGEDAPHAQQLVLVCPEALMPGELDRLKSFVPEAQVVEITREQSLGYDTNCLQVNETIIASDSLSATASDAFRGLGLKVVTLDLSELFSKGGGAPVCMTNRLWGVDLDEVPNHVIWSMNPSIEAHTDA